MKRPTLKRIALILAGLALLAIAAVGIFVASEWTYISRMRSHPANSILDVAWYQPKEAVPGAAHPVPLPVAEGIAPDAFAEAVKLAESKNASALLVVHKGRVVLDRHWHGHRPGDQTNSASMAKTVTALLIGIAVGEGKIASIDEPASQWIPAWRDDARRPPDHAAAPAPDARRPEADGRVRGAVFRRLLPGPRHGCALRGRERRR